MSAERGRVLRELRGGTALVPFVERLVEHGLPAGRLNRQRLSEIEKGAGRISEQLWDQIANALIDSGHTAADVVALRSTRPSIEPPPVGSAALRLRQWSRIASRTTDRGWWNDAIRQLVTFVSHDRAEHYRRIWELHADRRDQIIAQVRDRLESGRTAGPYSPDPRDRVEVARAATTTDAELERGAPFVLEVRLHNAGPVPWRDRLLLRPGAPVTTTLPFTPAVVPVPDTEPGGFCDLTIPGRGQWFPNLAEISYVMAFPDLSSCVPGRLVLRISTRITDYDRSFDLPDGFPDPDPGHGGHRTGADSRIRAR